MSTMSMIPAGPTQSSPAMEHPATERVSTAEFTIGPNAGMQGVWFDGELVLVSASWRLVLNKIDELNALIAEETLE